MLLFVCPWRLFLRVQKQNVFFAFVSLAVSFGEEEAFLTKREPGRFWHGANSSMDMDGKETERKKSIVRADLFIVYFLFFVVLGFRMDGWEGDM